MAPAAHRVPLVFASPHSGQDYPRDFVAASRLDPLTLRSSEDAFVDELFAAAPAHGAPLLRARFPRAYVDPNREAFELDPAMFEDPLPPYVNTTSPGVAAGLGTIARVVGRGCEIYRRKLRFADARRRIARCHMPYHRALGELLEDTRRRFGGCLLIDCHSMPSAATSAKRDPVLAGVDVVLGDRHATACAPEITGIAEGTLRSLGLAVHRNRPFAGGFTARRYGTPAAGVHVLQIEIARSLYMDEAAVTRGPGLSDLAGRIGRLIGVLARIDPKSLAAA